jgi:hypothetical protein
MRKLSSRKTFRFTAFFDPEAGVWCATFKDGRIVGATEAKNLDGLLRNCREVLELAVEDTEYASAKRLNLRLDVADSFCPGN